jgi:hypothetical protein
MLCVALIKPALPQPKLAYRLDCHAIMHKKLSGIVLNFAGNTAVFGDMLLGTHTGRKGHGQSWISPSERIFSVFQVIC